MTRTGRSMPHADDSLEVEAPERPLSQRMRRIQGDALRPEVAHSDLTERPTVNSLHICRPHQGPLRRYRVSTRPKRRGTLGLHTSAL